jgi:hypothetical protein
MSDILPPYSIVPVPQYLRTEIRRRKNSYGLSYVDNTNRVNSDKYKGPMTPWIRVMSNAVFANREGFILRGGNGFNESYGIDNRTKESVVTSPFISGENYGLTVTGLPSKKNAQLIGYDRKGEPHIIDNDDPKTIQKFRPIPGIESIEVDIRKDIYRIAFIKWKCYSKEQLDYLSNFMFTPYTTVLVEWGWNTFNVSSLVDTSYLGKAAVNDVDAETGKLKSYSFLFDGDGILGAYTNPKLLENRLKLSNGCYDSMMGHIINFDFTFNASEMCYNCTTELASNSSFYFGLSMNNPAPLDSKKNDESKLTIKSLFQFDIKSELKRYVEDQQNKPKCFKTDPAGRVFWPSFYQKITYGIPHTYGDDIYISLGLFVDILNDLILTNQGKNYPQFFIDIKDVKIGAHPNIISCNKNLLIPNAIAPYFNAENLIDHEIFSSDESKYVPLYAGKKINKTDVVDNMMDNILHNGKARQNLSVIINHNRKFANSADICFPMLTDCEFGSLYYGKIENLYINYSYLDTLIQQSKDIKHLLTSLCQYLNQSCNIWKLEVVNASPNNISISDSRFMDLKRIEDSKAKFDIPSHEPLLYNFETFTQGSVLKEFAFNVKLSDKIANMVLYEANNQLSYSDKKTTVAQKYLLHHVSDFVLRELPTNRVGGTTVSQLNDKEKLEYQKQRERNIRNIDESTIYFEQLGSDGIKKTSRLCLPESQKSKQIALMSEEDENILYTNMQNSPMPGVKVEFSILGIAGFATFQVFTVKNLPTPYDKHTVFQITEVKHSITSDGWITRITANVRQSKSLHFS